MSASQMTRRHTAAPLNPSRYTVINVD